MKLGSHVSIAGGLARAIDRAQEIGAETIQFFVSPPQGWAMQPLAKDQVEEFRSRVKNAQIGPIFLHGIYLINLGTPNLENLQKSSAALIHYMEAAAEIGASGVIFHAGSHRGQGFDAVFRQVTETLQEVIRLSPSGVDLVIENSAGMGNHIGADFHEIGRIINAVDHAQVKVCLDTQHCFAAGYDLATEDGLARMIEEFDLEIGCERLVAVHANDSKVPLGSGVDRHENIGEGAMGLRAFELILAHPFFRDIPFLLEVPGIDGSGPDQQNLNKLKEIRERIGPG